MAVQLTKPYRTKHKNNRNDAEAIGEAVSHPQMRFVSIKTVEQPAVLTVHRRPWAVWSKAESSRLSGSWCAEALVRSCDSCQI